MQGIPPMHYKTKISQIDNVIKNNASTLSYRFFSKFLILSLLSSHLTTVVPRFNIFLTILEIKVSIPETFFTHKVKGGATTFLLIAFAAFLPPTFKISTFTSAPGASHFDATSPTLILLAKKFY